MSLVDLRDIHRFASVRWVCRHRLPIQSTEFVEKRKNTPYILKEAVQSPRDTPYASLRKVHIERNPTGLGYSTCSKNEAGKSKMAIGSRTDHG
jgi:hypothetical protein